MTAFRDRVADVAGSTLAIPPYPRTVPSRPVAPATGLARQQALLDAASELAAEANAVLADRDGRLAVEVQESWDGAGFDIRVGSAHSRVVTTVVGDRAFGRILGDGLPGGGARELASPGELARLLLLLISAGYRDCRSPSGTAA